MDLYCLFGSPPCHAVLMAAKAVGVEFNKKWMNYYLEEQLKPEFLKINPEHTVPTIVDNDFTLWESRAILVYLVEKYGKNDDLYPKCPKKRAVINQRLYFDMGTLYSVFADYYYIPRKSANPEKLKKMETAFGYLNIYLEEQTYAAGDSLTLADIALVATVASYDVVGFDISKYTNVARWYENAKKVIPSWEENWAGYAELKKYIDSFV